eukprot:10479-Hanusia_phi.AAC.1
MRWEGFRSPPIQLSAGLVKHLAQRQDRDSGRGFKEEGHPIQAQTVGQRQVPLCLPPRCQALKGRRRLRNDRRWC